ncbi:MAG: hypothetical protein KKA42_01240 [candidate division Zixibacteria bacterium]|nr:hypothetical protein [candidate division Zixibacteria bacterium]
MNLKAITAIIVATILSVGLLPASSCPGQLDDPETKNVATILHLTALTGLDISDARLDYCTVPCGDSVTPFLAALHPVDDLVRFHYDGVVIEDGSPPITVDLIVYANSASGTIVKAEFQADSANADAVSYLSAGESERQISERGETYSDCPVEPPVVSLLQAIRLHGRTIAEAERGRIQYVSWSAGDVAPRPVWVIQLEEMNALRPRGPRDYVRAYTHNRMRIVVDAATGTALHYSTVPDMAWVNSPCPVFVSESSVSAETEPGHCPVLSPNEAIDRALEFTGFDKLAEYMRPDPETDVVLTVARDSTTPSLADSIDGREVWQVRFRDCALGGRLRSTNSAMELQGIRTYHAWIDSQNGRLLRLYSSPFQGDPNILPEPPSRIADEELGSVYAGIADHPPPVTISECLPGVPMAYPRTAKEKDIWLVNITGLGPEVGPCWVVQARGIPPMDVTGGTGGKPPAYFGRFRVIIDARTGKPLRGSNQPRLDPEVVRRRESLGDWFKDSRE